MTVMEAFSQFGKLAIGDGLVSSIPPLLISIASGVMVTRSDNDSSFGFGHCSRYHKKSATLPNRRYDSFVLAIVPGFPTDPFSPDWWRFICR